MLERKSFQPADLSIARSLFTVSIELLAAFPRTRMVHALPAAAAQKKGGRPTPDYVVAHDQEDGSPGEPDEPFGMGR